MRSLQWKIIAAVFILISIFVILIFFWPWRTEQEKFFTVWGDNVPALIARESDIISEKEEREGKYNEAVPITENDLKNYYTAASIVPAIGKVKGAIIPHHDIAGDIPAALFKYLEAQQPSVIVLIGPNHYDKGGAAAIATLRDWQTLGGILKTNKKIINKLAAIGQIKVDEEVMEGDYSLANIVPYIKKSLPDTELVPIMLASKTKPDRLEKLADAILKFLPDDAVVIGSVDFSHYQTAPVANFHDETAISAINNFDYDRLWSLDSDSAASIYTVLKILEARGAQKIAYSVSQNSADILHNPALSRSISYYAPYFVDGEINKNNSASLLSFGDIMLDRNVAKEVSKNGTKILFADLAGEAGGFFTGIDAVGANLEGPFANTRRPTTKSIAFRFDPALIPELKKYNFTTLSCANNHTYDMGAEGFSESLANLKKAGIDCYGFQYQINNNSVVYKKIGNFNTAFIGFNDTNSKLDLNKVAEIIKKAKTQADKVVINIHWGEEYQAVSNNRQRTLAHAMINAGADAIIGHHPHVVEEMEVYKNRPIFYSLGNFIFDQYFSKETQEGLAVGLVFYDKKISVYVFPLKGVKSQPLQMSYADGLNYLKNWQKSARGLTGEFKDYHLSIDYQFDP